MRRAWVQFWADFSPSAVCIWVCREEPKMAVLLLDSLETHKSAPSEKDTPIFGLWISDHPNGVQFELITSFTGVSERWCLRGFRNHPQLPGSSKRPGSCSKSARISILRRSPSCSVWVQGLGVEAM